MKEVIFKMTRTKRKLDEAKFFLDLLVSNENKDPDFDYFLSAFISSSRSVLWIMRAEYSELNGWEQWYISLDPTQEEKQFLKKINEIRVRSEKFDPLLTKILMNLGIPNEEMTKEIEKSLEQFHGKSVTFTIETIEESTDSQTYGVLDNGTVRFRGKVDSVVRGIEEFPDTDILEVCKDYFHRIEKIVNECIVKFTDDLQRRSNGRLQIKLNKRDS